MFLILYVFLLGCSFTEIKGEYTRKIEVLIECCTCDGLIISDSACVI